MKDFVLSFLVVHAVFSIFKMLELQRRLNGTIEALTHLAALVMIIGGGKPPEKK